MYIKKQIRSFKDLDVYQLAYKSCIEIMIEIIPKLPGSEKYNLKDQLSRSCKAVPRLIAEGYAKRHQKFGFQKYLDDARGESNETLVSLEQVKDIYNINPDLCIRLIDTYDKISRQLYNLAKAWSNLKK
ncbi:four helix bundle protein [Candidatus Roizmanbacteria bacterium RIFCSPHIGHO2_02_FULL_37_15]|uniref:Four helix bundle protein n=1 Tax=Candidatus Roizmanbacteria bacterium RIFCSPLOWO2_01_FULL_37_16 TaxID=1802058 RepID=A0A1F7ILE8_9BACT|nr:MAG: four helix bundle protein [Candidatus Roizmanbacteria bacterium RIFCSPHIGHO2_02_FULL_37_15]OGK44216.1 MAG: four helix bundle protein [Candidatus Roizmanbacteria bacterium RIFCSPLOWO2_01_FULL_37_16]OGK57585.1 MAG: four helix bundle protein [Candidatus Roizmanbacteria bacterium RIFCSPLOWO2_02_FULL_37_9]